jgi:hypothetical protein
MKTLSEIFLNPTSKLILFYLLDGHAGNPQLRAARLAVYGFAFVNCLAADCALAQELCAAPFTGCLIEIRC